MSRSSSNDRRAFYRLRYPETDRPSLLFDNMEFAVAELSESGGRIELKKWQLGTGRVVTGWVRFRDGVAVSVQGTVLRTDGDEAILHLSVGVSLRRMLAEQKRLIRLYPQLFERSDTNSRFE
jgi:hypothetical protein